MQITVKGRNFTVSEGVRATVAQRFDKVGKQVSPLATLEVELTAERNPAIPDSCIAEATLFLKGATLRAAERSSDMNRSLHLVADELAVQVKRHRDRRRGRREARAAAAHEGMPFMPAIELADGDAGMKLP